MRPIIGITVDVYAEDGDDILGPQLKLRRNYTEMVAEYGGVPIILPPTTDPETAAELIDGLLIPGGRDMDAARFGQENHPKADLQDPSRFDFEAELLKALPEQVPIFGICYGCQFINTALGGELEQHMPDRLDNHEHEGGTLQEYAVEGGSKLSDILGMTEATGKSYHHQSASKIAPGLKVSARHEDGTVEALESANGRWMIGVQWHPERTPESQTSQRLFAAFIDAARTYKESK